MDTHEFTDLDGEKVTASFHTQKKVGLFIPEGINKGEYLLVCGYYTQRSADEIAPTLRIRNATGDRMIYLKGVDLDTMAHKTALAPRG